MKIHIVQKGETLWEIAKKNHVDFDKLKKMNTQLSDPDSLKPGMKVKIPTAGVPVKKEKQKEQSLKEFMKKGHQVKEAPVKKEKSLKEAPKKAKTKPIEKNKPHSPETKEKVPEMESTESEQKKGRIPSAENSDESNTAWSFHYPPAYQPPVHGEAPQHATNPYGWNPSNNPGNWNVNPSYPNPPSNMNPMPYPNPAQYPNPNPSFPNPNSTPYPNSMQYPNELRPYPVYPVPNGMPSDLQGYPYASNRPMAPPKWGSSNGPGWSNHFVNPYVSNMNPMDMSPGMTGTYENMPEYRPEYPSMPTNSPNYWEPSNFGGGYYGMMPAQEMEHYQNPSTESEDEEKS